VARRGRGGDAGKWHGYWQKDDPEVPWSDKATPGRGPESSLVLDEWAAVGCPRQLLSQKVLIRLGTILCSRDTSRVGKEVTATPLHRSMVKSFDSWTSDEKGGINV